jgi:predicted RNase H-like nuclease (RuvC/YqgF family)
MDQTTYEAMKSMIDNLTIENKKLTSANREFRKKNKHLQRIITKLKDEKEAAKNKKSKTYYKNGRRGSKFNG